MSKSYERTEETTTAPNGEVLHRIRATRDIPTQGVKKGALGGWIGDDADIRDDAWLADNAMLYEQGNAGRNARISGDARVHKKAHLSGHAHVKDRADIGGKVWVFRHAVVGGTATLTGMKTVSGHERIGVA